MLVAWVLTLNIYKINSILAKLHTIIIRESIHTRIPQLGGIVFFMVFQVFTPPKCVVDGWQHF